MAATPSVEWAYRSSAFSSIRTVTVGSGISPDLLTPCTQGAGPLAGWWRKSHIPPVGNFTPP